MRKSASTRRLPDRLSASRAEADAEASRTYAAAFWQDPGFYQFLRTLRAYDKFLDDKTTLSFPQTLTFCGCCNFDNATAPGRTSPPPPGAISTGADLP